DRQRLRKVDVRVDLGGGRVTKKNDARYPDEVDPGTKIETADDRRTGEYENSQALVLVHQGMGDLAAAPKVPEAERVVTVNQDVGIIEALGDTHRNRRSF